MLPAGGTRRNPRLTGRLKSRFRGWMVLRLRVSLLFCWLQKPWEKPQGAQVGTELVIGPQPSCSWTDGPSTKCLTIPRCNPEKVKLTLETSNGRACSISACSFFKLERSRDISHHRSCVQTCVPTEGMG